ncbi:MAG: hypothetical protein C0484_20180 [Rhodospirillum sp.]|nr:hypothetical protein [Rhodospirillum sp.]
MLERLKGARPDQTEAEDRKRDEAKDGMPRFEPQPGGFGRRATPIATNPAANSPANSDSPPAIGARPAARTPQVEIEVGASPQFRKPEAPRPAPESAGASGGVPASPSGITGGSWSAVTMPLGHGLGDTPTRIADWLMRELKDQRGIHCETLLTAIGALAGYAAQQALWEGMVKPGKLAIAEAFKVMETPSGATYFFGDTLDSLLVSMEPKHVSVWKIVAGGVLAAGGEHLPNTNDLLRHCAATAGTSAFGLPRLPDDHLPSILPRAAVERFWPGARLLLSLADPLQWPLLMAHAAQKLMLAMKGSIAPDLAVKIVMEAAVPMSRVDPTTVPND